MYYIWNKNASAAFLFPFLLLVIPLQAIVKKRVPLVYHPVYNLLDSGFWIKLLQTVHPFDGAKYGRIAKTIEYTLGLEREGQWYEPFPVTYEQKLLVHSPAYLASLTSPKTLSQALDCGNLLASLSSLFLYRSIIEPMEYATGGTILAVQLALTHGWSINIGGGYHHASATHAEGGCIFADVPIALRVLWAQNPHLTILIVDLDAHQGNGSEQILRDDQRIVYFDLFNSFAGHTDESLKTASNIIMHPLKGGRLSSVVCGITLPDLIAERCIERSIDDEEYLAHLRSGLEEAFELAYKQFGKAPDLIVYNAGADIEQSDPWGCLNVSEEGIIERDQHVVAEAIKRDIPICIVLSGSYFVRSAEVISRSLIQIIKSFQEHNSEASKHDS